MKRLQAVCDRCNAIYGEDTGVLRGSTHTIAQWTELVHGAGRPVHEVDLCDKCTAAFETFVKAKRVVDAQ